MSCVAKLFSTLMHRLMGEVELHNQQYAFRPGKGPLDSIHNMVEVTQQRRALSASLTQRKGVTRCHMSCSSHGY